MMKGLKIYLITFGLLMVAMLTSCGGGGGGTRSSTTPNPPDIVALPPDSTVTNPPLSAVTPPPPPPAPTPVAVATRELTGAQLAAARILLETAEYDFSFPGNLCTGRLGITRIPCPTSTQLTLIKASAAYARGATGAGEIVTVVDSHLNRQHNEFSGSNKIHPNSTASNLPRGFASHGTATSSVAVGNRNGRGMHGVAYDAQLQFIHVGLGTGSGAYTTFNLAGLTPAREMSNINTFVGPGVRNGLGAIINHSFGFSGAISLYDETLVLAKLKLTADVLAQYGVDKADKKIVVWAAGNAALSQMANGQIARADSPEIYAGLGVYFEDLRENVLAVVAVDQNGKIAAFSNRCGIAKSFCLAAPGENVWAASEGSRGYTIISGTSFSAPLVSGSLALLRSFFRNTDGSYQMGNTELVARLLATADKSGRYANSDIYGQGLLDLEAATAPVGGIMMGLPGDLTSRSLDNSGISFTNSGFNSALQRQLTALPMVGFDALGAPFSYSAANWVSPPATHCTICAPPNLAQLAVSLTDHTAPSESAKLSLAVDQYGAVMDARLSTGNWWFSYAQHGGQALGLYAMPSQAVAPNAPLAAPATNKSTLAKPATQRYNDPIAFAAPYMSLVQKGPGVGWSRPLSRRQHLGFALTHGSAQFDQQHTSDNKVRGSGMLLDYRLPAIGLSLQAGAVHEVDSFLGARPHGAFGDAAGVTAFLGSNVAWSPGAQAPLSMQRWRLLGSAYFGRTQPQIKFAGTLHASSDIFSSAFSLGAARDSLWQTGDWFGVKLSQPLRVERGTAKLRTAVGRTKYGEVLYENHEVSWVPAGRNLQTEITYRRALAGGLLQTRLGLEHHLQHDNTRGQQPFIRLSYERRF